MDITKRIERMRHEAHLRYQRGELAKQHDTAQHYVGDGIPPSELRGCKTHKMPVVTFQLCWFTGLRPNFYKAYVDTIVFMTR